ncbi:nuclear transport factor 2 family protein [Psychroserpens algicola]|uniref:nuclear transport factor 2 family protein n=1 Tax=Psychroserpens algicola TaxID=1719034 RepID=UPI001954F58D|nr:nuclear transport factor 2 family protein [Psychroserpens algicola]
MKVLQKTMLAVFTLLLFLPMHVNAQKDQPKVTLEFKNAETANQLVRNYTKALQNGDVAKMNAQLHENAMIYGLGGALDSLNVKQHTAYFTNSTNQFKHSITNDLYLPVKVEEYWNEGEWLLSWGTNTVTDKKTGKTIIIPYHSVSMVEGGKIVFMRYFYDMLNIMESQGFTLAPPKQ